jgi:hypothetical protein
LFSLTFSLTPCSVFLTFFHLTSMFLIFFILFSFSYSSNSYSLLL